MSHDIDPIIERTDCSTPVPHISDAINEARQMASVPTISELDGTPQIPDRVSSREAGNLQSEDILKSRSSSLATEHASLDISELYEGNISVVSAQQVAELTQKLQLTTVQLQSATEEVQRAQNERQELEIKVQLLNKDVQDAHDFIFTLQPRRQTITDTDAAAEFKALCAIVEDWVQTKFEPILADLDMEKFPTQKYLQKYGNENVDRLFSLIPTAGLEAINVKHVDEFNVISLIMNYLRHHIFDTTFWCSMGSGEMAFLKDLEQSMRNLQPSRDFATIRQWHTETMTALSNLPKFPAMRNQQIHDLSSTLTTLLTIFAPQTKPQDLFDSLKNTVVAPATVLAQNLQLSVDKFELQWTRTRPGPIASDDPRLLNFDCRNLAAPGRTMKVPEALQGKHVVYLLDVCPGLSYCKLQADGFSEPVVLKRAVVLLAVTALDEGVFEVPPKKGKSRTFLRWLDKKRGTKGM